MAKVHSARFFFSTCIKLNRQKCVIAKGGSPVSIYIANYISTYLDVIINFDFKAVESRAWVGGPGDDNGGLRAGRVKVGQCLGDGEQQDEDQKEL